MTGSKSEFPLQINAQAIAEIRDLIGKDDVPEFVSHLADTEAPYEDIQTAMIILAFQKYMQNRHIEPGFEVVFE